jgi:hypothetical protein
MYSITKTTSRGFTLVETLIYAAGAVVLIAAIAVVMANMYRWYDQATITPRVDQTGVAIVDRIVRDVRTGQSINSGSSSFGTNIGSLSLNSKVNSTTVVKLYDVLNGRIRYTENSGAAAYISPSGMYATKFKLTQTDTLISKGIHVDLDITYSVRGASTTRSFSGEAIMRNSY